MAIVTNAAPTRAWYLIGRSPDIAHWLHTVKGGAGSGHFGHAGRPGERGGSDSDGSTGSPAGGPSTAQRKPSVPLSDRPVTRTQAIAVAIQKLDGGKTTGNLLGSAAGKHFFALGFKGPVIKQLYDLSQMYKAGGAPRQKAIGAIMRALASNSELGDALRAQIDTEDALAEKKAQQVSPAKIGKLPTAAGKRGQGKQGEDREAADRARAQREHDQELAGQIADEKRKKAKEAARWRGKVGETVYLGTSPLIDATDQGDTVSSGEAVLAWPEVVASYHVLAGLAVSYGQPNTVTLLRRDALHKRRSAQKGGVGSGFHGHAGRPGERGGSRKMGNTQMSRAAAEAFAKGSKTPGAYYHATSAQIAGVIRAEGFRLDTKHSSNYYGEGIYFTNKKGVKFFGDTDVEVRVNVKNPYIHLPSPDATQPFLTQLSTSPFADAIIEKMDADKTLSKAKALTLVLQEKGYDAVITREDEDVLVVFDPADIAIVEADALPKGRSVNPGTRKLNIGSTKLSGDLDRVEQFGLDVDGLAEIVDLGEGTSAKALVRDTGGERGLHIKGEWRDTTNNKKIGQFERYLHKNGKDAELAELAMEEKYIGKGKGVQAARQWLDGLAEAGYESAHLLADMTIGAYAWAREGVQYALPDTAEQVTSHFAKWIEMRRVPSLRDRLPTFHTPQDVATYQHPDGFVLDSSEIRNDDINRSRAYPIGKAYMLDALGHGPYEAVFDLRNRRKTQ